MATNSEYITIRVASDEKQYIRKIADREHRTVSQVARMMLQYAILIKKQQEPIRQAVATNRKILGLKP